MEEIYDLPALNCLLFDASSPIKKIYDPNHNPNSINSRDDYSLADK